MQSLKSLPADYRFDGSPISYHPENSSGATNSSIPRKIGFRNGVSRTATAAGDTEDSPYSGHGVSVEEQFFTDDVDPGVASMPLPQSDERRWSDTSAYARKKVFLRFTSSDSQGVRVLWRSHTFHGHGGFLAKLRANLLPLKL